MSGLLAEAFGGGESTASDRGDSTDVLGSILGEAGATMRASVRASWVKGG